MSSTEVFPCSHENMCNQRCTSSCCVLDGSHAIPNTAIYDESNDRACDKEVVILVHVCNHDIRHVATRFLDMPVCNIPTAESLFAPVEKALV